MNMIKNFNKAYPRQSQVALLFLLSVLAIFLRVQGRTEFFIIIIQFLPVALIVFAVYILVVKHKTLVAHLVLFLFVFADYLGTFIRLLFYNNFDFTAPNFISWQMITGSIAAIYLILIIMSYLLSDGFQFEQSNPKVLLPIILGFIYVYIRYGYSFAIGTVFPIIIVFLVNVPLAVYVLLLSLVIIAPIDAIELLIQNQVVFTSYFSLFITAFSLFMIIILAIGTIRLARHKEDI